MRLVAASADRVSASAASTNGESRGDLRGADGGASRAFRPVQGGCFELLLGAAGAALRNFSIFFFFFFELLTSTASLHRSHPLQSSRAVPSRVALL
jgi:hypothetical protein